MQTSTTRHITVFDNGQQTNAFVSFSSPQISDNGRFVTFTSNFFGAGPKKFASAFKVDLWFTENDDTVALGNAGENVDGLFGNDRITGGSGNDVISGNAGADILVGGDGDGDDRLIGGIDKTFSVSGDATDIDVLYGGMGNDTYLVNSTDTALDIVFEGTGFEGGATDIDTVISRGDFWWDFYDVAEVLSVDANAASGAALVSGKTDSTMNGNDTTNFLLAYGGSNEINPGKGIDVIGLGLLGLDASFNGANTVKLKPGDDVNYIYDFESTIDKVDVSAYLRFTDGAQMLANVSDTAWGSLIWLGPHEGEDEFVGIVGLFKADLDAGDFMV